MATIPYEIHGNGSKAAIFLHGFLDAGKIWNPVIAGLDAEDFQFITVDLPGMGEANEWPGPFDLRTLADAVLTVVDEINKPMILVGHSMGCQVAELMAVQRPSQTLGMVLLTPIPLEGLPVDAETDAAMHAAGGNAEMQRGMRKQFSPDLPDEDIEALVEIGMKGKNASAGKLFEAWSGGDVAGKKPCVIDVPVLVISGEIDPFAPTELVEKSIMPRFNRCRVHTLEGASHWPHVSAPNTISAQLNPFIREMK